MSDSATVAAVDTHRAAVVVAMELTERSAAPAVAMAHGVQPRTAGGLHPPPQQHVMRARRPQSADVRMASHMCQAFGSTVHRPTSAVSAKQHISARHEKHAGSRTRHPCALRARGCTAAWQILHGLAALSFPESLARMMGMLPHAWRCRRDTDGVMQA